jgi:tetratricopeptide (TPR) repeat protein
LDIDPAHEMSQNQWGVVAEKLGRLDEAILHYREALAIHPELAEAHKNLAQALIKQGHPEEAKQHEELAKKSDPNSNRQYYYWGRYLLGKGKTSAAVVELRKAVQLDAKDEKARELLTQALAQNPTVKVLDPGSQDKLIKTLSSAPPNSRVWFATFEGDAKSVAFQIELQDIFQRAGWKVQSNKSVSFRPKPGLFVFAAEDQAPPEVQVIDRGFQELGLKAVIGSGYRAYSQEKKRESSYWKGFDFDPEQTFILVIGPNPTQIPG